MIERYTLRPMRELWMHPEAKFKWWHRVELAVIKARVILRKLPATVHEAIQTHARIDVARINALEAVFDHDMLAFIGDIRESLKTANVARLGMHYHEEVTSYDIEDPALILMLREATRLIITELQRLEVALRQRAREHQWTLMIAPTHGQDAEPSTFGHLLLVYAEGVRRSIVRLQGMLTSELTEGRISGAVANYTDIDPELERVALNELGLQPAKAEVQRLGRDRHAMLMATLSVAAGTMQGMCETFWMMMHSRVRELREPRKPKQRGSSAMPFKRNPILTERGKGLPRMLRAFARAADENISTMGWRDIAESSVERMILPDGTALVHYLAAKLADLVANLEVFPQRMLRNLEDSLGVWAGNQVRLQLVRAGIDPDVAYEYVQAASFTAVDEDRHVREVFAARPISEADRRTASDVIGADALAQLFDARAYIERGTNHIFGKEKPIA